jgi:FkbM family methyltransferase
MPNTVTLTLIDGVRIVVPDALDLITPYVLREQLDFFEDELPFVRQLLQLGQNVIDIGANYGTYTLSMARKVGASGHVWAFEPASSTAQLLAQGIAANGFNHVTLEQKAVSNVLGSAQLARHAHSELRSISHHTMAPDDGETVSLVTLDDCMDRYRWVDIDFIKMDAEGEEINIVKGGRRFFAELSPLVQYELNNAGEMNLGLIREFSAIGYRSYRLLPSLNLLVPFGAESPPDPYLLNLFSCNETCAERLAARGVLLRPADLAHVGESAGAAYHWRHALKHTRYAAQLASAWEKAEQAGGSADVHQALSSYARSRDAALPMAERLRSLEASFVQLKELCAKAPVHLRLASLARVAHEFGERAVGVDAVGRLIESIRVNGVVHADEPFLPPLERFDSLAPGEALAGWMLSAALEHLERRGWMSSFYAGPTALDRLQAIHDLGFSSSDMERRLNLVRLRIDLARAAKGLPPLAT